MQKLARFLGYAVMALLGLLVALAVVLVAASYALSPSNAGRDLALRQGIPHPAVIAHRGLSQAAPEETAPAYLLAREIGADYLELDVQRSQDGVLIALHDDTLQRTTDVAKVFPARANALAGTFTWAELQRLNAGAWFNQANPTHARPAYTQGLTILRLQDVLEIAAGGQHRPGIYLETKSAERYPGYEKQIVDMLSARGWIGAAQGVPHSADRFAGAVEGRPPVSVADGPGRIVFQSFVPESLAELQRLAPDVPRVLLVDSESVKAHGWQHYLDLATRLDAGIGPAGYEGWPWYTGAAHRAGRLVHPYTLNVAWQMRLMRFFGADGLFTDAADIALLQAGRPAPQREAVLQRLGY